MATYPAVSVIVLVRQQICRYVYQTNIFLNYKYFCRSETESCLWSDYSSCHTILILLAFFPKSSIAFCVHSNFIPW